MHKSDDDIHNYTKVPYQAIKLFRRVNTEKKSYQIFGIMTGPGKSDSDGDYPVGVKNYAFWCPITGTPELTRVYFCDFYRILSRKHKQGFVPVSQTDLEVDMPNFADKLYQAFTIYILTNE